MVWLRFLEVGLATWPYVIIFLAWHLCVRAVGLCNLCDLVGLVGSHTLRRCHSCSVLVNLMIGA